MEERLREVLTAVDSTSEPDGFTDSDRVNARLGRDLDDRSTDGALSQLKNDLGYIEGYRDGEARWHNVKLTGEGHRLLG